MAIYNYSKYTCLTTYSQKVTNNHSGNAGATRNPLTYASTDYYSSYTFDSSTGRFAPSGTKVTRVAGQSPPVNYYFHQRNTRIYQIKSSTYTSGSYTFHYVTLREPISSYARGNFIGQVAAEDGTYPTNGRHSDGYWYVIGDLVTPGTPTSITVPTEIEGGTTISISWGTSSNSDSFRLERRLDGGVWAQIYNGVYRSYSDTVPKDTLTVAYRVRGANGMAYSSYRTSSTVTVKNFPEIGIRVNGAVKTSDAGWVRIGGQLKEIDTMWVRINGAIKEVQ